MGIDINQLPKWAQDQIAQQMAKEQKRRLERKLPTAPTETADYKPQKYGNKKEERVLSDGTTHIFDSKKEAKEYDRLALMEKAGEISDLQLQVKYELIPAQYVSLERYGKDGKRLKDGSKCVEKACSYIADFVYTDSAGQVVVEDTKGMRTSEYIIKRKLMRYIHGIEIKEI